MKRAFLILFVLVLLVGLALAWRRAPGQWQPGTQGTFLAFTDTAGTAPGTNALFMFTSIPAETTAWTVREISHWDGTNWQVWNPPPPITFAWADAARTNSADLAAVVPLQSTSAPARIVFELRREGSKVAQYWSQFRELLFRPVGVRDARKTYYMTNYVPREPAAASTAIVPR